MKKKKDILFLCQFFHPEYISSAQLPFDTAKALHREGFQVGALCGYPSEYLEGGAIPLRETVDGVQIHRLKYLQLSRAGFLGRLVNYFSFTLQVLLHLGEISAYRAVVVYSNPPILPWVASWAKCFFGTKLVFVSYDLYPEVATVTDTLRQGSLICRLMNHINRCVYRRADRVVALSQEMQEYILKHRQAKPELLTVIPNWYPGAETPVERTKENPMGDLTKGRFTVSYFGNMGTMQDMETILQAVRLLREADVFFLFAGHGNKLQQLKEIAEKEGISNLKVLDFLHGDAFRDALAISDCALISLTEGATGLCVPSKTYSYMMQGIPLLAVMDESDITRDIDSGAGCWVRNHQGQALARAIMNMKNDPAGCQRMAAHCRKLYLEKYTVQAGTEKYLRLFAQLLNEGERK